MKKLALLVSLVLFFAGGAREAFAQTINIGSLDGSRSRAPFATEPGELGYGQIRSSLADPANFGLGGVVWCPVSIAAGTNEITDAYLADKDVFFTSVFTGDLSSSEMAAINAFVANGGVVIVDANSDPAEQTAATSLMSAIGTAASLGPGLQCGNDATGGLVSSADNILTNGPFGDVRNQTFGTSPSANTTLGAADSLVTCSSDIRGFFASGAIAAGSGLVMFGGDPSAFDLFTSPAGSLYNPSNEVLYLNAIAESCDLIELSIDIKPGSYPNSINACKSQGKIPVAILSTQDFDAPAMVDPDTVTFGATGDEDSLAFCNSSWEDVNYDGLLDLVCHFNTPDTGFCEADEAQQGVLRGSTYDSIPIAGYDSVRLVPPGKP